MKAIPEFDSKSDNARKSIEDECLKKHPGKQTNVSTVEVERNLKWDNLKADFAAILSREQVRKQNEEGRNRVRSNVVPAQAPVCC